MAPGRGAALPVVVLVAAALLVLGALVLTLILLRTAAACGGGAGVPVARAEVTLGAVDVRELPPLPAAAAAPVVPMFAATVAPVDAALAVRMATSWHEGCPVPLADLRYLTVPYVDFGGVVRTGELVVHADVADGVTRVFARLFELRYPIRSMRLVDDFGGSDDESMAADNTSAFNCRPVTGGTRWSEHAYGRALDLNPVENPYVARDHVAPDAGAAFVVRVPAPGVVLADDAVVQAFAAEGWQWGGEWLPPLPRDYQHFSTTGR